MNDYIQNPLLLQKDRQLFSEIVESDGDDNSYKSVFNITLFKKDKVLKELYVSNAVVKFLDNLIPTSLYGDEKEKDDDHIQPNNSSSSSSLLLLIQRMLSVIRYQDYFCMFFQPSLRNTRVVRWTNLMLTILLNLFIDTLFFGVFYPDTGSCESYTSKVDCLQYTNMATDDRVCQWSTADKTCSPNPPPSTYMYVVVVVMMTLIVSVPMGFLYEVVIWQYCVRRPKIKGWSWFSYSKKHSTDLYSLPGGLSPLSELFSSFDEDRATTNDDRHLTNEEINQHKLSAVNNNADQILSIFYDSVEVESEQLLQRMRQLLHECTTSASIPWKKETSSSRHSQLHDHQQHQQHQNQSRH
jgi:hypothetical protein